MRNFKNLQIWKDGINLVKETYRIAEQLPDKEKFGLRNQICRAAVSIPSNIAEGSSRNSNLEYKRFLEIALGSAFELETQLIIIQELSLTDMEFMTKLFDSIDKEQRSINSLISKIKENL
jgi:four helix bundle protein